MNGGAVNLFPHVSRSITVRSEHVGSGMLYCTVIDHVASGMSAVYNVRIMNDVCTTVNMTKSQNRKKITKQILQ